MKFHRMTVNAAADILSEVYNQTTYEGLTVGWGFANNQDVSVRMKMSSLARIATEEEPEVLTAKGKVGLAQAMIEKAIAVPERIQSQNSETWATLQAGLRFDGFEIVEHVSLIEGEGFFGEPKQKTELILRRMLPQEVPETDFREAESEVIALLNKHDFKIPLGHLQQAFLNFSGGHWAAANSSMRSFYEGYLEKISDALGYTGKPNAFNRREFLEKCKPPFLLSRYNEPKYVQGLMTRMHTEGPHPGLSGEDDCTFRLQMTLINARLFLRRFDQEFSSNEK